MIRVGFTYNIKNNHLSEAEVEWDTPETIETISKALRRNAEVVPIEASDGVYEKLKREKLDIVFNYAEGMYGEEREAQIPAILESLGVPYTGSDPITMKNCSNKARAKELLMQNGVRTAEFLTIDSTGDNLPQISFPCIVKPVWEGSSKGIHNSAVVNNKNELKKIVRTISNQYHQPALVESFLPGREFTVGILGNDTSSDVLPIIEIDHSVLPDGFHPILSYEVKWVIDSPSDPLKILLCPAEVDESLRNEIEKISLEAYRTLGCRDWCRIDIRLDGQGKPNILELNPLPGLLADPDDNSCLPTAARAEGMCFEDLVNQVLEIALERYGIEICEPLSPGGRGLGRGGK